MSLTAADVAEIMRLVEQSTFDELTLEFNGTKLTLRRGGAGGQANGQVIAQTSGEQIGAAAGGQSSGQANGQLNAQANGQRDVVKIASDASPAARASLAQGTAPGEAATRAGAPVAASSDPNVHDVPSPLLGTFYRAPKPGAPPFVEVGSRVEADTIVAIIEVMKLMNTVRAGVGGTVTEILPTDGTLVEYDEPLLRIRKQS